MPKYKCINKECSEFEKVKHENSKLRIVSGEVKDLTLPCLKCGHFREELKDEFNGFTTTMYGSSNISRR